MSQVVEIPEEMRTLAGGSVLLEAPGETLGAAISALAARHPALGRRLVDPGGSLRADLDVLIGGRDARLRGGLAAVLRDGVRIRLRLRRPRPVGAEAAERYARQTVLPEIGAEGQERLAEARVAVVGLGGLGAPALMYLAAAGVGHLVVIDGDRVDRSNLHRQPIHRDGEVGLAKAASARRFVRELNPQVEVLAHEVYVRADNVMELLRDVDIVVSGADNLPTRYVLSDACVLLGIPLVDAAILGFEGRVGVFLPGRGCYRCLFPVPPPAGSVRNCAEAGVIGAVAGQIGATQALEALKLITGAGESLAGRLLVYDGRAAETRSLRIRRDPRCPVCGDAPTQAVPIAGEAVCGMPSPGMVDEIPIGEAAALVGQRGTLWVDVRPLSDWERPTVPGALRLPLEAIEAGERPDADGRRLIVFCEIGRRSLRAVELLRQAGLRSESMRGGLAAWRAAALPLGR